MADETRLGANFSIDTTDLKAGLAQANRLIRESESEFKAAAAGMDDWSNSEEGLSAKIKSLNDVTDIQRKKVDALKGEYDRLIAEGLDPTSKQATELRTKINNETAALNKNEAELKKQTQALEELADSSADAGDAADDMGDKFSGLKAAGGIAVGAIAAVGAACVAAVGSFLSLAESTREARTNMAKLETSFTNAGLKAEDATNTFAELYSVLGDEGKATESAAFLAQYADNEEELAKQTRILTGVFATYGDSIPTEGLAEGVAATISMGEVQGVLADALEWQGVNLDEFNASLAACANEQEREALITETLTGLYGEAADKYKEVNADVIASQKAQAELNEVLNELGAIAEPIMTTLKKLTTDLLKSITPFVSLIGKGLTGALEGSAGASEMLSEGLAGIANAIVERLTSILPTILSVIVQIIPQIVQTLVGQLPTLLQTVIGIVIQIVNTLTATLPQIITAIMEVLPMLINQLIASIPQLLQAAIQLLMALVDALPTIITALINALPSVIDTIITAVINSIPLLLDASIQLLMAIIDAIPVILDAIIENLPTIIDAIINGVLDALPLLFDASITLFFALIDAIPVIVQELMKAMPQIIGAILTSIRDALPKLFSTAKDLFGKIIEAVGDLIKKLPSKMGEIISSIVEGLKKGISKIKNIGSDIIKGLWNGIKDMGSWIGEKIKGFGDSILSGIKNFFGIHSPSKVMSDQVGKNLALGIGEGFEKNIGDVNDEITSAMNFDDAKFSVNAQRGGFGLSRGGTVINYTNNFKQAYTSQKERYKAQQQLLATVRLAKVGG
jgi:phage-related protein